jgi:hypothetical protein
MDGVATAKPHYRRAEGLQRGAKSLGGGRGGGGGSDGLLLEIIETYTAAVPVLNTHKRIRNRPQHSVEGRGWRTTGAGQWVEMRGQTQRLAPTFRNTTLGKAVRMAASADDGSTFVSSWLTEAPQPTASSPPPLSLLLLLLLLWAARG